MESDKYSCCIFIIKVATNAIAFKFISKLSASFFLDLFLIDVSTLKNRFSCPVRRLQEAEEIPYLHNESSSQSVCYVCRLRIAALHCFIDRMQSHFQSFFTLILFISAHSTVNGAQYPFLIEESFQRIKATSNEESVVVFYRSSEKASSKLLGTLNRVAQVSSSFDSTLFRSSFM